MKVTNVLQRRIWFIKPWLEKPLEPGEEIEVTELGKDGVMWMESDEDKRLPDWPDQACSGQKGETNG